MSGRKDSTAETVQIEVDGHSLQVPKGVMLIEVTDRHGIYVPRFCYHTHLSVAANCRMCLVEVEKAPKPLPACATPVNEGMRVQTRSKLALEAQRAVMEFLLINHPLDCPICDQGGECELQDLAMGFGRSISRYQERKRVVRDRDVGPLVQTDMTRCIHCTRCVRFGEEVAGLRELGALGRGEHMEIGTYVEHSMVSELSGNIIDLCPVGALTSKPFRYSARTWEMQSHNAVSPHDAVGSNLCLHVHGNRVKRVVPAQNEAINEVWLADRDRFSYQGLYSEDRLMSPMIRQNDRLVEVDWAVALDHLAALLQRLCQQHGPAALGALSSPSATLEEHFLLQRLVRGLGSANVDHRLRQADFSAPEQDPLFPWLGCTIAGLECADAVLLVGSDPRKEQPLLNHRLRKAARSGGAIMAINATDYEFNYDLHDKIIVPPSALPCALGGVLRALLELAPSASPKSLAMLKELSVDEAQRRIAQRLHEGKQAGILLGASASAHPSFSLLRQLAGLASRVSQSFLGYLPMGANSAGACLAGALPHRGPLGSAADPVGLDVREMLKQPLPGYLFLGIDPELDCLDGGAAQHAVQNSELAVFLSAWRSPLAQEHARILLPIAQFAETGGTLVNLEGTVQHFKAAVPPPGEARPAWKILRALGDRLGLEGFDFQHHSEITKLLEPTLSAANADNKADWGLGKKIQPPRANGFERCGEAAMYAVDALVRHADALQRQPDAGDGSVRLSPDLIARLQLKDRVRIRQGTAELVLSVTADARIPPSCAHVQIAQRTTLALGPCHGPVELELP